MATSEEREHAGRMLDIHRKNLRELEERAAKYAGEPPLYIVNQMDEERANIALLEPIARPAPSASVQSFVTRVSNNNGGDWAMLFSQVVLLNTRMTQAEGQNQKIIEEQSRASLWRMQAGHDIQALQTETVDRIRGQQRNFRLSIGSLLLWLLLVAALWILLARAGLL